jgi:hypothetical protein
MRHVILSVACLAVSCFLTPSHKRHDFLQKKKVEHKMCVLKLSKLSSENFRILRKIQRDIIINVHSLHVK